MAVYEYHAIRVEKVDENDYEKSIIGGVVLAKDRQEAKEKLRKRGLKATMLKRAKGLMALIKWFDADVK